MERYRNTGLLVSGLLFAVIPLMFIAGIVVFQLAKNVPDARIARANTLLSFKTIRAANAIDEAVQDAARGQRGFLITDQDAYLEPYTKAKERLPQLMVELQQVTNANHDQQERILKLRADITTKMNELAETITAAATGLRSRQSHCQHECRPFEHGSGQRRSCLDYGCRQRAAEHSARTRRRC